MFDSYHYCAPRTQLKIVHRNGCGPVPQLCGYTPDPDSEYWRGKKNFYVDLHVNIEVKQSPFQSFIDLCLRFYFILQ